MMAPERGKVRFQALMIGGPMNGRVMDVPAWIDPHDVSWEEQPQPSIKVGQVSFDRRGREVRVPSDGEYMRTRMVLAEPGLRRDEYRWVPAEVSTAGQSRSQARRPAVRTQPQEDPRG